MQVMDIVERAITDSGVVPTFNPNEIPEDYAKVASDILRHEIIPTMNCDRDLDITEVTLMVNPARGYVDLRTTPEDYPFEVFGTIPITASAMQKTQYLEDPGHVMRWVATGMIDTLKEMGLVDGSSYFGLTLSASWPTDRFGNPRNIAIWSDDIKLLEVSSDLNALYGNEKVDFVNKLYNVPFNPMRVLEVYRATDGSPLKYVHAGELVSAEYRHSQLVYTEEDYPDKIRVRLTRNAPCAPLILVLPMPIRVINSYEEPLPWQGDIVAPEKFRMFLIQTLAWSLATLYGVATAPGLEKKVEKAYANLLKNKSRRDHEQDIPRKIFNYLERARGWRAGANGYGYAGGY